MKIEMEFQGLKELMKAFEDAASDEDIKEVNQKIVKQSEPVVKNIMSGKIPKSADIKLSGRGFGSKSSVTSHAADSIPLGAVKVKDVCGCWMGKVGQQRTFLCEIHKLGNYLSPASRIYLCNRA